MYPVVLYQMGKVGSSSLKGTLNHYGFKTLHIHRYFFNNNERPISPKSLFIKLKHNLTFNRFLKEKKVKVITVYRNPLPRNISSFFQNLDVYFSERERNNLTYEMLEKKFNNSFRFHDTPNNWFDLELNKRLSINIFEAPFNKEKGYAIIKKDNIELLICTTININTLENEFAEFLEVKEFKLIQKNIGDNKWYKDLYKEFKDKYRPSQEMLDKLYDSETIKHFFTPKTIEELKGKWFVK